MSNKKLISIELTADQKEQMKESVQNLSEILIPMLKALTPRQRQTIPKMGDRSIQFVNKVLDYASANPEFLPAYMNGQELAQDIGVVNDLNDVYRPLMQIIKLLDDSIMLAGSEAFKSSLQYYNSVKMGAKMNVPGAKTIAADLAKRFERGPKEKEDTDTE